MAKRFIDTDLFKKRFVRSLPGAYKILWVYLFCECDYAGIWEADLEVAELYCGQKFNLEDFNKALGGKLYFFDGGSKAFIPEFIEFQYGGELNKNNPAHRSVIARLEKYDLLRVLKEGKSDNIGESTAEEAPQPLVSPSPAPMKKPAKTFYKPSLEEVTAYCSERGNDVNPQSWLDYYTSNGWKVGRNSMKDWKAAVRTWERNGITNSIAENGRREQTATTGGLAEVPGTSAKKKTYKGTL